MTSCCPSRAVGSPDAGEAAKAAGRRVDLDLHRLVAELAASGRQRQPTTAGGRPRSAPWDPREAERRQVDDGLDAFVGELGGPQRALGTQVEGRVGQDHRGSPGHVRAG